MFQVGLFDKSVTLVIIDGVWTHVTEDGFIHYAEWETQEPNVPYYRRESKSFHGGKAGYRKVCSDPTCTHAFENWSSQYATYLTVNGPTFTITTTA